MGYVWADQYGLGSAHPSKAILDSVQWAIVVGCA